MTDLIYPEESYKIVGVLFDVYRSLGYGLREKDYQKTVAEFLKKEGIKFKEQVKVELKVVDKIIRCYYLDFLIDNKIILEIKAKEKFYDDNISQVYSYLKASGLKLGIIANFTRRGVNFKRIVNLR